MMLDGGSDGDDRRRCNEHGGRGSLQWHQVSATQQEGEDLEAEAQLSDQHTTSWP